MDYVEQKQAQKESPVYEFGEFELSPKRGTLLKNGEEVPLRHQCFEVLQYLVQHPGTLVTKQELMDEIWPEVVVTESSLPQCIFSIRKALDDGEKTIVRSIPRSGYRFDIPVSVRDVQTNMKLDASSFSPRTLSVRLVWPAGLTLALSLVVLLGSWQAGESQSMELAESATTQEPSNTKPEALRHLELGQFFYGRRAKGDMARAVRAFRTAVEIEPGLADAWVGLAGSLWLDSSHDGPGIPIIKEDFRTALEKALALNPDHPEANARLAMYYSSIGDDQTSRKLFDRALTHGRDDSWVLARAAGAALSEFQYEEAVALQQRAVLLSPLSYIKQSNLAAFMQIAGRQDEAIAVYQSALDLAPDSKEWALQGLSRSYLLQGRYTLAESVAVQLPAGLARDQTMALIHVGLDRQQELNQMIDRLSDQPGLEPALLLAEIFAFAGNTKRSFEWLEEARKRDELAEIDGQQCDMQLFQFIHSPFLRRLSQNVLWQDWQAYVISRKQPVTFFDLVAANSGLNLQDLPN